MAIPNSGPLGLRATIGNEFYGNVTGSDISIHEMSQAEGYSTPDTFSEFYGYSSAVTITLDGGQSRTGAPGASGFGTMNYNVNAPSNKGFTNSDAQNAAISSGLPAAFQANFVRTGTSVGRWDFTTPDGNFPDASYALQTTNMSIQNPSTPIYTFNVNGGGSAPGQYTSTAFQGETAGISMSVNQNTIGYLIGGNANAQSPGNTVNTFGGQSNSASQGVSINRTLNGNVQSSAQMQAPGSPTTARAPEGGIVAPPWGQNPVSNMQGFAYALYTSNQYVDNRVSACIQFHYNHPGGSGTNNSGINFHRGQFPVPNQFFQGWAGSGSGNYCLCLRSNHIFNTVFGYPNPSPSWGWTASDIRLKNNITYL